MIITQTFACVEDMMKKDVLLKCGCIGLACGMFVLSTACDDMPSNQNSTYNVTWTTSQTETGISIVNNTVETILHCDQATATENACVINAESGLGVWDYYILQIQSTVETTVELQFLYHIGNGVLAEGELQLEVGHQKNKLSVVMYNDAELLQISMYPFATQTFTGSIIITDSYLSNESSGTTILHCTYPESVPSPPPESSSGEDVGDSSNDSSKEDSEKNSSDDWEVVDDSPIPIAERLYNKYNNHFKIGMTAGYERYNTYQSLEGHFNSFTTENEMKLYTIASNENTDFNYKDINTYDFSQADEMLTYMRSKGKKIRGHALIWHYEAPDWIKNCKDKATLLDMIDTYCYNVVKHFSDKFGDVIYAWDVVNEAVSDNFTGVKVEQSVKDVFQNIDDGCNEMRKDFWDVAGLDYITTAFKAARRADPNVKLYYNDYNICTEKQKLRGVMNLVSQLIDAGAPIDGVGLQSHFKSTNSNLVTDAENAINYLYRLSEVKQHPLDIQITELDVENRGNNDSALATFYGDLFAMYRRNSDKISSVTFWGVADDYSWLDNGPYNMAYPFLFDKNKNKKPAFDSVFDFS